MPKHLTRIERVYRAAINALLDRYFSLPTSATLGEITAALSDWRHVSDFIESRAATLARQMVTMTARENERTWRAAATQASQGASIYRMLAKGLEGLRGRRVADIVHENAQLIVTVPRDTAERLTPRIQQYQMQGFRPEQIVKMIRADANRLQDWQVLRIARTEAAKASTAVTQARAEDIGLHWYQWVTSEDGRVRASHKLMDKVLINWADPPNPEKLAREKHVYNTYQAGGIFNCRCLALPLVSLAEISFPARVHVSGEIKRLSRKQFALLSGRIAELAA